MVRASEGRIPSANDLADRAAKAGGSTLAWPAPHDAATAIDKGDDTADFAGNVAAAVVPDLAVRVTQDCIQAHGGIGFTWEHDAHLYFKRAKTLEQHYGSTEAQLEQARARLEQTQDPEAAIEVLSELAEIAKRVEAELAQARREAGA